jgi:hypothetical protein
MKRSNPNHPNPLPLPFSREEWADCEVSPAAAHPVVTSRRKVRDLKAGGLFVLKNARERQQERLEVLEIAVLEVPWFSN